MGEPLKLTREPVSVTREPPPDHSLCGGLQAPQRARRFALEYAGEPPSRDEPLGNGWVKASGLVHTAYSNKIDVECLLAIPSLPRSAGMDRG